MIFLALEFGFHVQKHGKEARRDLILRAPAEGPRARGVHIDRTNIRHEDFDWTSERDIQALWVPTVVRHIQSLEQSLADAWKRFDYERVRFVHRNR